MLNYTCSLKTGVQAIIFIKHWLHQNKSVFLKTNCPAAIIPYNTVFN